MEWKIGDSHDARIVSLSQWLRIDRYKELRNRTGVFLFADSSRNVKYVGSARSFRLTSEIYRAVRLDKDKDAVLVKALYTDSAESAESLRKDLISKYQPVNNLI